jgi:hypothetical protein
VTARYRADRRRPVPLPADLAVVLARWLADHAGAAGDDPRPEPTGTDPNGPGTDGTWVARAGSGPARDGVFSPVSGEPA